MLRLRVLGEVGVVVDGIPYEIAAPRQRALLAILAFDANRSVSAARLIEDIWGEQLPVHPEAALQVLVSRLRTALGPAAARVVSGQGSYRLDAAPAELDIACAMEQLIDAQTRLRENEPAHAVRAVDVCLSRWSADPLSYLAPFPCHARASRRVRELWAALSSIRIDALLALGRHVEVLAGIDAWIADSPWDEQRRAQQMRVLYLSGRQVDALRAYDEFREQLIDELGIDPTANLQGLYRGILHQDPSLVPPEVGLVSVLPPWTSLRLPFMGRNVEEERVLECLRSVARGGPRMILVEGVPGIGKTRLALEIARRVQDDAVVIAATGNDARRPAVGAIAEALVDVILQLDDVELSLCLGRWPAEIGAIVPRLRERVPDLGAPIDGDPLLQAEQLRRALVSCMSALSRRAPILLVIDDLHRAGPELLMLLGYLMKTDDAPRVAVLATARTTAPDRSSRLAHLATTLEAQGLVERVVLDGLDVTSVKRLLAERRIPDEGGRAAAIHELTGGQPFFLGEMLDSDEATSGSFDHLPTSVLDFVRYRVHALGAAEERLLADATVLLTSFDIPLLAAAAGASEATAQAVVMRSVDANILRPIGLTTFSFAHEVTRRALAETLDDDRRAEVHRMIAVELEARGEPAGLLASHWRHATGPDAAAQTVNSARAAGEAAMARHDPGGAASWFAVACAAATDPAIRGRLLARRADAEQLAGFASASHTLRAAITIARETGDTDLLITCATAWAPTWSSGLPFGHDERVQLLGAAAEAATADADRALLLGRLATEMLYTDESARARPLAADALALAERSGDRRTRIEVHLRHFDATWSPHFLDARRSEIAEVLDLARAADVVDRCFALSRAASSAIEAVDLPHADAMLAELFAVGARHDLSIVTHTVTTVRAWRTGLAGNLDEAERLVKDAGRLGNEANLQYASLGTAVQLLCIAWSRGRFAEVLPVLELADARERAGVSNRVMRGRALAAAGRRDEARELMLGVTEAEIEELPRDPLWAMVLIVAAEAAYMVGATDVAAAVYRQLAPFAERVAFGRTWVIEPIAFGAALAAAGAGHPDADELFQQAVDVSVRLDAPVLRARAEIASVWAALRRSKLGRDRALFRDRVEDARSVFAARRLDVLDRSAADLAERVGP